jgi:hypothetical protein
MLSDTLFDARTKIKRYESQYADEYHEIGLALTKVKIVMRAMQAACDL